MEYQTEDQEIQEANRIATEYFRKITKTEPEAQEMMGKLARVLQDEGAKIVHLGNVLFLILVRGKAVVEVHTIGEEKKPRDMANNFLELSKYLKNIGVTTAYTYAEDEKFKKLAKMVDLPINQYKADYEGKKLNVFVVEL
jgi:hypothetical protein